MSPPCLENGRKVSEPSFRRKDSSRYSRELADREFDRGREWARSAHVGTQIRPSLDRPASGQGVPREKKARVATFTAKIDILGARTEDQEDLQFAREARRNTKTTDTEGKKAKAQPFGFFSPKADKLGI